MFSSVVDIGCHTEYIVNHELILARINICQSIDFYVSAYGIHEAQKCMFVA